MEGEDGCGMADGPAATELWPREYTGAIAGSTYPPPLMPVLKESNGTLSLSFTLECGVRI